MKKIIIILNILFITSLLYGQSPYYFNYQAVVRNIQDQVLKNHQVSFRFSILQGSNTGSVVFEETHNVKTSDFGIVNFQIGKGQNQTGTLQNVNWRNNQYWLKVEMDETNGTNFLEMGTSQLISVPYALHAETVANPDDSDADPQNELQTLSFNTSNNELSISNGNSVTIPSGGTDADPNNEIQVLSKNGNIISLSKNGGSVTDAVNDADDDATNELQTLSLTGNTLSISNGNNVNLSPFQSYWKADGNGIKYDGSFVNFKSLNNFNELITIHPHVIASKDQNEFQSYLNANELKFQNLSISPKTVAEYGYWGIDFIKPGSPILYYAKFNKDSIWQFDPGVGLVFPLTTKMTPGNLKLDYGDFEICRLSGFGLQLQSKDLKDLSLDVNEGLQLFEYVSPNDRFTRLSLMPDSLILYNDAKWKYIQLGKDPDFGTGMLKIMDNGGNGEKAHLVGSDSYYGGGAMFHLLGSDGGIKAEMETPDDIGLFSLYGQNDSRLIFAVSDGSQGGGYMDISDTLNDSQVRLWVTMDSLPIVIGDQDPLASMGHIYSSWNIYSPFVQSSIQDTIHAEMNNLGFETDGGFYINKEKQVRNSLNNLWNPSLLIFNEDKSARGIFRGTNGNSNVEIFGLKPGLTNDANFGAVYVYNDQGIAQAGIEVDPNTGLGIVWGNSKQFRVQHPDIPNKEIIYASLEGPEAAAYIRGTAKLVNGEAFVEFPDYFEYIANPKSMTVIITPLDWNTYGLAVIDKMEKGFKVKELKGGQGDFSFDWEVKCVRKGYEDFEVIRDKRDPDSYKTNQLINDRNKMKKNIINNRLIENNNHLYQKKYLNKNLNYESTN